MESRFTSGGNVILQTDWLPILGPGGLNDDQNSPKRAKAGYTPFVCVPCGASIPRVQMCATESLEMVLAALGRVGALLDPSAHHFEPAAAPTRLTPKRHVTEGVG